MIKKYRKKPVVIEAAILTPDNARKVAKWSGGEMLSMPNADNPWGRRGPIGITIQTLEGKMIAEFGDYIIKGIQGEFYPCKPAIFKESYDAE